MEHDAIDLIWAGHSVDFGITIFGKWLYVGYYDANRQLTIARRPLRSRASWTYHKLDSWLGWDSHNSIVLACAQDGSLHVAANMHSDPLVYYQSRSGDVRQLQRQLHMTDPAREGFVTYPKFLRLADKRLAFTYRDGSSGRGSDYINVFDEASACWVSQTGEPIIDGENLRNAYFQGPVLDRRGWYHLAWVWRDSQHAETNHDLCYAKSRDLINWYNSNDIEIEKPIRFASGEIVDPVPVNGGIINGNTVIGFDARARIVVTYHKYDKHGNTQIWIASKRTGVWVKRQITEWKDYRWNIQGGGTIIFEIELFQPYQPDDQHLVVPLRRGDESIDIYIDPESLRYKKMETVARLGDVVIEKMCPPDSFGQIVAATTANDQTFLLCWSTRAYNRDQPGQTIPPPSTLNILEI
ncbi:BNR repeat-containing protein [Pararhizobium gei]|uniref:BNR repeat-containing protein n=1 Tax=Pararhizobium gei TaxID=1395951 RepID=UPI0023DCE195|nr:BNR repeat-containing protein [Rhizobium gei]